MISARVHPIVPTRRDRFLGESENDLIEKAIQRSDCDGLRHKTNCNDRARSPNNDSPQTDRSSLANSVLLRGTSNPFRSEVVLHLMAKQVPNSVGRVQS